MHRSAIARGAELGATHSIRRACMPIANLVRQLSASLGVPLAMVLFALCVPAQGFAQSVAVWVNTSSNIYHCAGTRYFRATRSGALMSESRAKQTGNRPAYGKVCGRDESSAPATLGTAARGIADKSASSASEVRVWVNTKSGVYHCSGTRFYGKTKSGRYMSQSIARADGNRPAYGSDCAQ